MRFARLLTAVFLSLLIFSNNLFGAPLGAWYAYVANQTSDNVTPIQLAPNTGTPLASISLAGTVPVSIAIAISPDGNRAYVVENDGAGSGDLAVINTLTNTLVMTVPISGLPIAIAISPDGLTAYVANLNGTVIPVDITAPDAPVVGTAITLPAGSNPLDIAIAPDGLTAYAVDVTNNRVIPIDLTTDPPTVGIPIAVGSTPVSIAITPDGTRAYVANSGGAGSISVIDLASETVIATITTGIISTPTTVAINSTGTRVYVASTNAADESFLTVIDIATNTVLNSVFVGDPVVISGIAITPDNRTAYLTDFGVVEGPGTTVIPVDISTDLLVVGAPISLVASGGLAPAGIAITPDQAPIAFFTATVATLGSPTVFDASASVSPVGTIVLYEWDFGDGTTAVTTSPVISHTYAAPGEYVVVLTVTNSAGTSTTQTFTGHMVSNNGGPSAIFARVVFVLVPTPPLTPIFPIFPPTDVRGVQKVNKFASQADYINILTWKAPCSGTPPVAYRIYRNAGLTKLAATISADKRLKFKDHNRKKGRTYRYFIVAVDETGRESIAACVVVHPK